MLVAGFNHVVHDVVDNIIEKNAFEKRFHNVNPDAIPDFNMSSVDSVMGDVDGLSSFYNSSDVDSPEIFLSEAKGYSGVYYDNSSIDNPHTIELTREAFASNYHLARTIFHESYHSLQYNWNNGAVIKGITQNYGEIKRYHNGTESRGLQVLERQAYSFVWTLGDNSIYTKSNIKSRL